MSLLQEMRSLGTGFFCYVLGAFALECSSLTGIFFFFNPFLGSDSISEFVCSTMHIWNMDFQLVSNLVLHGNFCRQFYFGFEAVSH